MKKGMMAVIAIFCALPGVHAQQEIEYQLNWTTSYESINSRVIRVVDSLYSELNAGQTIRMVLLSATEKAKPEEQRAMLSFKRGEALLAHFRQKGLAQKEYEVEMVPFHQPNRLRSSEITSRSFRSFMSRKSESFFLLSKIEAAATSVAQVFFDSDISGDLEVYQIYASRDQYVMLNSGNVIYIPAGTLKTDNGMSPSCDLVEVRVAEYTQLEAIALKAMTTSSYGKRLETGGMWHITFNCNGKSLKPGVGESYYIRVKFEGEPRDMKVFTGDVKKGVIDWRLQSDGSVKTISSGEAVTSNLDSVAQWSEENYESDGEGVLYPDQNYGGEVLDGYYSNDMYELKLNDVGWINCDAFYEVDDKTDLLVNCDTAGRVNVMLIFKGRKSLLPGYQCSNTTQIKFSDIAANELALLIVFRKNKDNTVDKFVKTILPANQKVIDATDWKPSTSDDLRNEIYAALSDF
ncbi:MAG: hypothetical protein ACHQF2_12355 [Flavobacteriales bacterium]